jgi:hypothetical protein
MDGEPGAVLPRWRDEAEKHWRAGDYAWMAGHVAGSRVVEVGCGIGCSTQALVAAACRVLVVEADAACRAAAAERVGVAAPVEWLAADVLAPDAAAYARLAEFAPDTVVCWLFGVPDAALAPDLPAHQAVAQAREKAQRSVAELAARLPSVARIHFVDRTAFPWKIKDTARDTLLMLHTLSTLAGLPFSAQRGDAVYRKLDASTWPQGRHGVSTAGIVAVLGSLLARRSDPPFKEK